MMLAHGSCAVEVSGTADWTGQNQEVPLRLKGLHFTHIIFYTSYISAVSKDIWDIYDPAKTLNIFIECSTTYSFHILWKYIILREQICILKFTHTNVYISNVFPSIFLCSEYKVCCWFVQTAVRLSFLGMTH